jgi:DNA/RNA-binding domain of Phe-tRNA-synthetase-like protein
METGVPVWALDSAAVEGPLRLRAAQAGEGVPAGRLVVAGAGRPLAVLFGAVSPDAGVTERTREMVLFTVAVPGVPPIHVEEALWTVWDTVASE